MSALGGVLRAGDKAEWVSDKCLVGASRSGKRRRTEQQTFPSGQHGSAHQPVIAPTIITQKRQLSTRWKAGGRVPLLPGTGLLACAVSGQPLDSLIPSYQHSATARTKKRLLIYLATGAGILTIRSGCDGRAVSATKTGLRGGNKRR
jgi:hypothetical protein